MPSLDDINSRLVDIEEATSSIRVRVKENQGAITTIKTAIEAKETGIEAIKTATDENRDDIAAIKALVEADDTGTKAIKTATDENRDDIAAIKALVEADDTGIKAIKAATDENRDDITAIRALVEADDTGIKAIKTATEAIRGSSNEKTGIAGLRAVLEANQSGAPEGIATKADLSDLEARLLRHEREALKWLREHRVARYAVLAAALMLLLQLLSFFGIGLSSQGAPASNPAQPASPVVGERSG